MLAEQDILQKTVSGDPIYNNPIQTQVDQLFSIASDKLQGLTLELSMPSPETLHYRFSLVSELGYRNAGGTLNLGGDKALLLLSLLKQEIMDLRRSVSTTLGH